MGRMLALKADAVRRSLAQWGSGLSPWHGQKYLRGAGMLARCAPPRGAIAGASPCHEGHTIRLLTMQRSASPHSKSLSPFSHLRDEFRLEEAHAMEQVRRVPEVHLG